MHGFVNVFAAAALAGEGDARARFLREARTMANVDHPHVVRVYALGESEGQLYLVMEYVEGRTLAAHLASESRVAVEEALRIAREVAQALAAAWARGIVHRDVKPANILLDAAANAKVADFGLARPPTASGDAEITSAGMIAGTPHYMAPEQLRGETSDFRSDVYSLGIVLYEMLGGERPFQGKTPAEVVAQQLTEPVPFLRLRRPEVPLGVDTLVHDMTAKTPRQRPPSYPDLLRRLSAAPVEESGTATMIGPVRRPARCRPWSRWLLAAAALAAFAFGAIAWRYGHHRHGSFAVVVAPLHAPDVESEKEGRVLVTLVENELRRCLPEEDVEVIPAEDSGRAVRTARGAKALAERFDADVVVWGDVLAFGGEVALAPRISRRDGTALEVPDAAPLAASGAAGAIEARRARAAAVAQQVAALYPRR